MLMTFAQLFSCGFRYFFRRINKHALLSDFKPLKTILPSSMRKINQIVTVSIARAIEVQWVTCRGVYPYFHIMNF